VARFRGGLSVLDFVKLNHRCKSFPSAVCGQIAPVVEQLATTEGLKAHAESVR